MLFKYGLKLKLLFLCLFLITLIVLVGGISFKTLAAVKSEYSYIPHKVMPKLEHLNEMYLDYRRVRISLRTLGIQDLTAELGNEAMADAEHVIAAFEKSKEKYISYGFEPGQKELFDKVDLAWLDFKKTGEEVLRLFRSGTAENRSKMINIFFTDCPQKAKVFTAAIDQLEKFHNDEAHGKSSLAETHSQSGMHITLIVLIFSILSGLTFGFLFATFLSKRLSRIAEDVSLSSEQTSLASHQIATASSQLASGTSESAASLEETVASIEELTSMVKRNSDHSLQASNLAKKSIDEAQSGEREIIKLTSAMNEISASSKKIEEIISVIDDIAFQTNLLALNAAVEAARAGEQGRGFAVVAEAVRNLAQKSSEAAKDISALISENVLKSKQGVTIAEDSGQVFKNIFDSVKKVADISSEIAAGSQEQSNGIQQISTAMNQLDQAIQGSAGSAEEAAATSEEMSAQAKTLLNLVHQLNVVVNGSNLN